MGFKEQLNEILHKIPSDNRLTLFFSATMPQSLVEFARPDVESKLSDKLKMAFFQCRIEDKLAILIYLLSNELHEYLTKQIRFALDEMNSDGNLNQFY
jgi:ATP-dependent RNA helicase DDX54/DBP10